LVTQGAQPVIAGQPLPGLAQSPLWGLGRVISEELPAVWGGLLDLDPAMSPREGALRVFGEIVSADDEDQVAYRGDQRYAARLVPRGPAAVRPDQLRCRSDASYLVSGGLGDLGLRIA
ncbi:MAG: hypothetical protein GTO03_05295, partial [Planctomycetales bacterium]|nr:hypothetical protein [Planctomycetales bacterium]